MEHKALDWDTIKRLDDAGKLDPEASKIARKACREGMGSLSNKDYDIYERKVASQARLFLPEERDD